MPASHRLQRLLSKVLFFSKMLCFKGQRYHEKCDNLDLRALPSNANYLLGRLKVTVLVNGILLLNTITKCMILAGPHFDQKLALLFWGIIKPVLKHSNASKPFLFWQMMILLEVVLSSLFCNLNSKLSSLFQRRKHELGMIIGKSVSWIYSYFKQIKTSINHQKTPVLFG